MSLRELVSEPLAEDRIQYEDITIIEGKLEIPGVDWGYLINTIRGGIALFLLRHEGESFTIRQMKEQGLLPGYSRGIEIMDAQFFLNLSSHYQSTCSEKKPKTYGVIKLT